MAYGTLAADTIQSSTANTPVQFNDGNGTQVGTLCRAWVNFNGSGGASIRASFNVSSITRTSTGNYTVNFTNAMADTNYAVNFGMGVIYQQGAVSTQSTGSMAIYTVLIDPTSGGGYQDSSAFHVTVHR